MLKNIKVLKKKSEDDRNDQKFLLAEVCKSL